MTEPTSQAADADIAEQARPVDDDIEKLSVSVHGGEAASADSAFWPIMQFNSLAPQRSFIDDMASLGGPYRPNW
ncbi:MULTISPECIES: hypothetical protein [unclassified Mycobacterium]|uniref:hypothetical protein n=1 Tax=unclassified Mycobacterium TaxID=2642494 RepID=UPI0007FC9D89|nr:MULTISPECIES: hypothetical protein [unclassified Mycobacterium]OBI50375.1 hypothetical protein A5705_11710 [Mycobacterium sp. E787]